MTVSAVRPADPYGQVCRRWSGLPPAERDRAALRLVGVPVGQARIHDPGPACHGHYAALVEAALAGDEVAFGWLADSHRPLLVSRGRALFERDPGEWGAASLEVLYRALTIARRTTAGRWLRRRVAQQICHGMTPLVRDELARRRSEQATDPARLAWLEQPSSAGDPHPELTVALRRSLAALELPVRAGFEAAAARTPIGQVAGAHQLSPAALRQRMSRARNQLRPELAGFLRSA